MIVPVSKKMIQNIKMLCGAGEWIVALGPYCMTGESRQSGLTTISFGRRMTDLAGASGPQSSAEAATREAIAHCKQYGGTDPRIKAHWADGMSGQKK